MLGSYCSEKITNLQFGMKSCRAGRTAGAHVETGTRAKSRCDGNWFWGAAGDPATRPLLRRTVMTKRTWLFGLALVALAGLSGCCHHTTSNYRPACPPPPCCPPAAAPCCPQPGVVAPGAVVPGAPGAAVVAPVPPAFR